MKVCPKICVRSAVSQRWLLKDKARKSCKSGVWLLPDEAAPCYWNEGWLAHREAGKCRRSGLTFETSLIDSSGQFKYFAQLMTQKVVGHDGSQFIEEFRRVPQLKRTQKAFFVRRNQKSRLLVFRLHVETRFKMEMNYVGLIAKRMKDGSLKIQSPLTQLDKKTGGWTLLE